MKLDVTKEDGTKVEITLKYEEDVNKYNLKQATRAVESKVVMHKGFIKSFADADGHKVLAFSKVSLDDPECIHAIAIGLRMMRMVK